MTTMAQVRKTILVVDDDADIRDALRLMLEGGGYRAVTAASGEEGLLLLGEVDPDAVIVDLMMEEIDAGVSFAKELRVRGCRAPVFMLSSVGDSLSRTVDYGSLALAGIFQKPVDSATMLGVLAARLAD